MNRLRNTPTSLLVTTSAALIIAACSTANTNGSQSSGSGNGSGSSSGAASGSNSGSGNSSGSANSGSSGGGSGESSGGSSGAGTSGNSGANSGSGSGESGSPMDAAVDSPSDAAEAGEDVDAGWMPPDCTNTPVATWNKIYTEVVSPLCGNTCHNGGNSTANGGGLDLFPTDQARAWRNLVTQPVKSGYPCTGKAQWRVTCPRTGTIQACAAASTADCACNGPGDPEMSVIYTKLIGMPICGNAEPQGTAGGTVYPKTMPFMPLPDSQICDFYTWIKAGAMDNGF
jgi:hypothetical protein